MGYTRTPCRNVILQVPRIANRNGTTGPFGRTPSNGMPGIYLKQDRLLPPSRSQLDLKTPHTYKMESEGEESFFKERDEVVQAICLICGSEDDGMFSLKFEYLTNTLSKYQEQPTLLSPSLGNMVDPLTQKMLSIVQSREEVEREGLDTSAAQSMHHLHAICKVLHLISRVRGFKHVVKLFPHEVSNLETCLSLLKTQDRHDYSNWETRYVFLMWLCILCLIPFDICSMDSSLTSNTSAADAPGSGDDQTKSKLVHYIVELCKTYLSDTGPTREAASACLSALLTRPDMETDLLSEFISSSCASMSAWAQKGRDVTQELNSESFHIIGVLHCISQIFKKGHRSRILRHASTVLAPCLMIASQANQTLTRKLTCKLAQRIGMTFLPPRVAAWRYQRGQRSLLQNLQATAEPTHAPGAHGGKGSVTPDHPIIEDYGDVDEFQAPDELENIVDHLLGALQDKDTVVRWNASKGLGRITMRLSKSLADDIVGAVLELFEDKDADSAWHGGCLALAELTRRGLLLPERLVEVVPVIQHAIHFDVLRGQHSVGAHVRDAACYVCWAFARAYSPLVMRPFIANLASAMLITSLYDREINCRRAASAAFQENVGRQGNENFPFGIEIISIADYFSLGNRSYAYLQIAPAVAMLAETIQETLADHLLNSTISHWDEDIRSLASQALARLSKINAVKGCAILESLLTTCFSPAISIRHGSVLAVAEVTLELVTGGTEIPAAIQESIVDLVIKLEKARMYRGRGGELLRHASCLLVENLARSHLTVEIKKKIALVDFLNENLRQPHEYIQKAASSALRQFLFSYFNSGEVDPSERLQSLTVLKYMQGLSTEENVAATRGYALALGILPLKLATQPAGRLAEILQVLSVSSSPERLVAGEADAETRRNSVQSTVELVERAAGSTAFTTDILDATFGILFKACQDHSVDKRGDTGSWSRIVALEGLERIVYACLRREQHSGVDYVITGYGPATLQGDDYNPSGSSTTLSQRYFVRVMYPTRSFGHSLALQASLATGGQESNYLFQHRESAIAMGVAAFAYITEALLAKVVCAFCEQMAGKLDAVRDVAGNCLHRFVSEETHHAVGRIPDSALLTTSIVDALAARKKDHANCATSEVIGSLNWAQPGHVFPFLAQLLDSKLYFHSIIGGLVVAVGGLTESVVKESSAVLLEFCRSSLKSSSSSLASSPISQLAICLTNLFGEQSGNDRIMLPLLKTMDTLLRHGIFDAYRSDQELFVPRLLAAVKEESSSSTNVIKIKACIDVLIHLLQFEDPIRSGALKALIIFLGHKYPRVRNQAAENLYIQFLSDRNAIGPSIDAVTALKSQGQSQPAPVLYCGFARTTANLERAQDLLASTSWDGPMPEAREKRLQLCALLEVTMQIRVAVDPTGPKKRVKQVKDELDSYDSLVRTAGY